MYDLETFFLVLVIFYLVECSIWLPRGTILFRQSSKKIWTLIYPSTLLGNHLGGLGFRNLLPIFSTSMTADTWPISISPEGVYSFTFQTIDSIAHPYQEEKFFHFTEINSITVNSKKILINGKLFVRTSKVELAHHLAELIDKIRKLKVNERESAIRKAISQSFDTEELNIKVQNFLNTIKWLKVLSTLLFLYLFLAAPIAIFFLDLAKIWLWLLTGLFCLSLASSILYYKYYKKFYLKSSDELLSQLIMLVLAPVVTIRACDLLSKNLFFSYHPLAIAKVLCSKEAFLSFSKSILIDIKFPLISTCFINEIAPKACEEWFRKIFIEIVEKFIKQAGINYSELIKPPLPTNEKCLSYCPRCHHQYLVVEGECINCGDMPLHPFTNHKIAKC